MTFGQSISYCFANYFNFNGRGSRSEYWWFILFCIILEFAGTLWDSALGDTSGNGFMYWVAVAITFFQVLLLLADVFMMSTNQVGGN